MSLLPMALFLSSLTLLLLAGIFKSSSSLVPINKVHFFKREGRIVGGQPVVPHSVPFIVNHGSMPACAGSILNKDTILTAAHCYNYTYVVAGDHRKMSKESTEQRIQIARRIDHPQYSLYTKFNFDFAILKLAKPLQFKPSVQPIALPELDEEIIDTVLAFGWGDNGTRYFPDELFGVYLTSISSEDCQQIYGRTFNNRSMICAQGGGARDACKGDSGGPLVRIVDKKPVLVGVTSWGPYPCADSNEPGVWARVGSALDFIKAHM